MKQRVNEQQAIKAQQPVDVALYIYRCRMTWGPGDLQRVVYVTQRLWVNVWLYSENYLLKICRYVLWMRYKVYGYFTRNI